MNKLYKAIGLAMLLLLLINAASAQTSTSATYPGSASGWSNSSNIRNAGSTYATTSISSGSNSSSIVANTFGFSIPTNATITGFQVSISRKVGNSADYVYDNDLRLQKAGNSTGTSKADASTRWPSNNTAVNYGSTTDLWGTTWTPSEVNATNFGVYFKARNTGGTSATGYVDYITVAVTYTLPVTNFRSAASGNWNANGTWEVSYDNGTSWSAAGSTPTSSSPAITIMNTDTVTITSSVSVDELTIDNGGAVSVNSGVTLTVANGTGTDLTINGLLTNYGTITNNGSISVGSTGKFVHDQNGGTIPTANWDASSTTQVNSVTSTLPSGLGQSFGNLVWNSSNSTPQTISSNIAGNLEVKNNSALSLGAELTIAGNLVMTSGTLDLGNYTLRIGGISGGSSSAYVKTSGTGQLKLALANAATVNFPVGNGNYAPVSITNNTGSSDSFAIRVLDEVYVSGLTGAASTTPRVKHTWDISKNTPSANAGTGINMTFTWNAADESGSFLPALYHYNGSAWGKQDMTKTTAGTRTLTFTGYMGSFSPFAVLSTTSTLPVIWRSFDVEHSGADALLTWVTTSEENTRDFEVEHSIDGRNWETIGRMAAAGNSTTPLSYHFTHRGVAAGMHHYRVKQTDLDGQFGYSAVVNLNLGGKTMTASFKAYPNPAGASITLTHEVTKAGTVCRILSLDGKTISMSNVAANTTTTNIDLSRLKSGLYIISLESGDARQVQKIQKL